jgi:tRNA(Arg) A34 adenosine deaminase TadA
MTSRQEITAIIYNKRGQIISIGKNSYKKTHPYQAFHAQKVGLPEKMFCHAEISAILKCKSLKKQHLAHTIKVSRFTKNGEEAMAKPCPICQSAIDEIGIKNIIYTQSRH